MRFPLLSKAFALACVMLGLLWALWSVQSIVRERQSRQLEAEQGVANSLAGSQALLGPVLSRVCTETWTSQKLLGAESKPVVETRTQEVRLAAAQMKVAAKVEMTPRYRGMFKVNGYAVKSLVNAQWPDVGRLTMVPRHEGGRVSCEAPILSVALSDARGIRMADLRVNGQVMAVAPGSRLEAQPRGFHARLPASRWPADSAMQGPLAVSLDLEMAGTHNLSIAPVADATQVSVHGDWPHPSFGGRFLPSERYIRTKGFEANWQVSSLASTAQQEWLKGSPVCTKTLPGGEQLGYAPRDASGEGVGPTSTCIETFGVDFIDPVNPYVLSDRASKYGLLFIVLTFVAVGLVEVLRQLRVHPVQYLLVGAALAVFFLLLVSLSEHMAFGVAYLAASLACTVLLGFYGSFVLRGTKAGLVFGLGIGGLFGTLYALLQMEQTALVMGAVLLFLVLAGVMIATRSLDWYALMARMRSDGDPAGGASGARPAQEGVAMATPRDAG